MSNQRTLLIAGGAVLVLLLVFVSSQSGENGRLRVRLASVQEDAIRRQSELERELATAQNQSLLFSSRIDELRAELLRQTTRAGSAQPIAALPEEFVARVGSLETEQRKLATLLGAAGEQRDQIVAAIKTLEAKVDAVKAAPGISTEELQKLIAAETAKSQVALTQEVGKVTVLVESVKAALAGQVTGLQEIKTEVVALNTGAASLEARIGQLEDVQLRGSEGPKAEVDAPSQKSVDVPVRLVDTARGVLILDGGTHDGLVEEQILEIRRANTAVARVRVRRVQPDMAGAQVIRLTPGAEIRIGDRAVEPSGPVEGPGPQTKQSASGETESTAASSSKTRTPPPPPPGG